MFSLQHSAVIPADNLVQRLDRKTIFRSNVYHYYREHDFPTLEAQSSTCFIHFLREYVATTVGRFRRFEKDRNNADTERFQVKPPECGRLIHRLD